MEKATFAAGCFWGVQHKFKQLKGVVSTQVGYTGGEIKNPDYNLVCTGKTGHAEAVEIIFKAEVISYEELVETFWNIHNPTSKNKQGMDIGNQYRSAIFYHTEEQKHLAKKSKENLETSGKYKQPIVTEISPAREFYSAEEFHQNYYDKQLK